MGTVKAPGENQNPPLANQTNRTIHIGRSFQQIAVGAFNAFRKFLFMHQIYKSVPKPSVWL